MQVLLAGDILIDRPICQQHDLAPIQGADIW